MTLLTRRHYTIRTEAGDAYVNEDDGEVQVIWFCGDSRTFTREQAKDLLRDLGIAEQFPDCWLHVRDKRGSSCYAQVIDGEVYVGTSPHPAIEHLPAAELTKAIRRVTKAVK